MLDRLTLDHLRILVAVAETGSFSAAARKLQRVQSAVSQAIQNLETTLAIPLFDRSAKAPVLTDAGRAILADARHVISGAEAIRTHAERIASDIEPELTLAVDAMFPNGLLMASLKTLTAMFPDLPVTVFTEALGGSEQRLLDGAARLGLLTPRVGDLESFESTLLARVALVPVAAADHPLAQEKKPITRDMLERQVQLVLTDRTQITANLSGGVISRRIWRFADLATRLEYLRAGFGWCNMPLHMVEDDIRTGRLKHLHLAEPANTRLPIHVVHARAYVPGKAGQWLLQDLRRRLAEDCPKEDESASTVSKTRRKRK